MSSEALAAHRFFVSRLLDWYGAKKRDLPWRRTRDPYAILVSEMMLQQTQVATVIPFFERWMRRFPTLASLAEAPLDDVLKHWQGLGYYARARNLQNAARRIVERHDGVFPTMFTDVLALPGIGRYTAGAVCSIAFDSDVPIVDANVVRVLCRYFGIRGDPKTPGVQRRLWELAEELVPAGRASAFNQGMMELGALVCDAKPTCGVCPVRPECRAYRNGTVDTLPEFAPRPAFTKQTDVSAIIGHPSGDGRLLLVRRPVGGLWAGLYEFPRVTAIPEESLTDAAVRAGREVVGMATSPAEVVASVRHGVTTRKITLYAVACRPQAGAEPTAVGCDSWVWVTLEEIERYALASPQVRLASQLTGAVQQPSLFG